LWVVRPSGLLRSSGKAWSLLRQSAEARTQSLDVLPCLRVSSSRRCKDDGALISVSRETAVAEASWLVCVASRRGCGGPGGRDEAVGPTLRLPWRCPTSAPPIANACSWRQEHANPSKLGAADPGRATALPQAAVTAPSSQGPGRTLEVLVRNALAGSRSSQAAVVVPGPFGAHDISPPAHPDQMAR
jgi:hypothetical protein